MIHARIRLAVPLAAAACAGLAVVALPGTPAPAATTETTWGHGVVVQLSDGDTPYVDIADDGTTQKQPIRFIDVQAMETRHYLNGSWHGKDWCHGPAATRRLAKLEPIGGKVRMESIYRDSKSGGRRLRTVLARQPDGSWLNVERSMVKDGYVIWFPMPTEHAHNLEYHLLADRAARNGRRVWNKTYCGKGPQQAARLRVWVHWDANGGDDMDNAHRNDEYVIIRNNGGAGTVNLSGWYVRETGPKVYQFPSGTKLPVGHELRLHTGHGSNTATNFYWDLDRSVFDQVAGARYGKAAGVGDGAFLLDPDGDFRAWNMYPCVRYCHDPFGGDIRIRRVGYDIQGSDAGHEYVDVRNAGTTTHRLAHIQLRSWPWNYVFPRWFRLRPGATVRVHIVNSASHPANSGTDLYWFPSTGSILNNDTDEVDISTLTDVMIACRTWNNGTGESAQCHW